MKVLILAGLLVVFISVIFILLLAEDISSKNMKCFKTNENKIACSVRDLGVPFAIGLLLIGAFCLIDVFVIYFLLKTLTAKESLAYFA